jgi:HrpA-like RNA helicase
LYSFESQRFLTVSKRDFGTKDVSQPLLHLSENSQKNLNHLINYLKANNCDNSNRNRFTKFGNNNNNYNNSYKTGRLISVEPNVPQIRNFNARDNYQQFRQQLPIYGYREEIINAIASNRVVIISGDTGCGKTTQVPQYLLDYCANNNLKCRIVCAEPRRLAAISVSERISVERNESLGQTVGYQIRLESK